MKLFRCQFCGQLLYYENTKCEKCGRRLGYLPGAEILSALEPEGDTWRARASKGKLYRFCANADFGVCNWMIDANSPDKFCVACRHNRMVPDTTIESNVAAWRKIELAKHSLFYTLLKLRLPLDGRPDDPSEAERRIGITLRHETAWKDAFFAHHLDRRISWRIALMLARTGVTPNQVTLANTALGLAAAAMIAMGGYWPPLLAALMLLVSVTIDGVDGELARMKLSQSDFGAALDAVTDCVVNFAMFAGIAMAAYRMAGPLYLKLFGFFLIGCALSAATAYWVYRTRAADSLSILEKLTSRDFVYAMIPFALAGRMDLMMWLAVIGSFIFPIFLWSLTFWRPRAS